MQIRGLGMGLLVWVLWSGVMPLAAGDGESPTSQAVKNPQRSMRTKKDRATKPLSDGKDRAAKKIQATKQAAAKKDRATKSPSDGKKEMGAKKTVFKKKRVGGKATSQAVTKIPAHELRWQIDAWEIRERALAVAYAHEDWKKYTRDPKFSTKKTFEALTKVRSEKGIFRVLEQARKQTLKNPVLARRVTMLWERLREYHLSDKANKLRKAIHELQDKLNGIQASYRAIYKGKSTSNRDLMQVIRRSPDRKAREAAWRAYAGVGRKVLQGGFMKMIRLRNQYAKLLGFPTFFHYRYRKLRLHPDKMWTLYETLRLASESASQAVRRKYKAALKVKRFLPWDRRYALQMETSQVVDLSKFFQANRLLPILFKGYREMGFSLSSMQIEMDLYPRAKKNQHAYCFDIDPPYDVRILANVGRAGLRAYETMFHEMGHAVHAKLVRQPIRTFRGLPDEGFLNEGSANFFGNIVDTKAFYERYLNLPKGVLDQVIALKKKRLQERLYLIRWTLLWMYFERDLYIHASDEDPTPRFWQRYEQFQADKPKNAPPYWGVLIHFVSHPIYYQNYLIADLLAAQLHNTVKEKTGIPRIWNNPKVAAFLTKNFFAHGRRYRWDELLKKMTGKTLSAKAYLNSLRSAW